MVSTAVEDSQLVEAASEEVVAASAEYVSTAAEELEEMTVVA